MKINRTYVSVSWLILGSAFVLGIALFAASAQTVRADTTVGGAISSDTTWNLAGSPYHATSTVSIASGVTLTITPGVSVTFDAGVQLYVGSSATLIAQGTVSQLITFTSSIISPTPSQKWNNIFADNTSRLRLAHCDIGYGGNNFGEGLYLRQADVIVSDCRIHDNPAGVYLENEGITATL